MLRSFELHMKMMSIRVLFRGLSSSSHSSGPLRTFSSQSQSNSSKWSRSCMPAVAIGIAGGTYTLYSWQQTPAICEEQKPRCKITKLEQESWSKKQGKIPMYKAIMQARDLAQCIKDELGCPGLTVAVSIDGQVVWAEGLGYADIEKRTPCSADTVMRIASISKPITMTAAARLMQAGKLDIDKPVKEYIDAWPQQTYKGQNVDITTRQLVSHMSGIRHYEKDCGKKAKKAKKEGDEDEMNSQKELQMKEYYIKEKFTSVASSLNLFKNDELCSLPGTEYLYTTHGWTAVSAVIEGAAKKPFADLILQMFKDLGLTNTYLDDNGPLIYNRSSYYVKNKKSQIENAPYVDNSYKYAGGGFVSTASDLCRFANVMLFSYQQSPTASTPGYLASDTVKQLWSPVDNTSCSWNPDGGYGMGWVVIPQKKEFECGREQRFSVSHTGAAIGASSALFILPSSDKQGLASAPSGVAVAMICNLQDAGLQKTAEKIAHLFDKV